MRKLTRNVLSTVYKQWVDAFERDALPHPKYNSSQGEHYKDIVLNLLNNQNGLCAYTEVYLGIKDEDYQSSKWTLGRYSPLDYKLECDGDLDHFDPTLKSKTSDPIGKKDWLWENFFVAYIKINRDVKKDKAVFDFFNPTHPDYSPEKYLAYDRDEHRFVPLKELPPEKKSEVQYMIDTLGLNYGTIVNRRERFFRKILFEAEYKNRSWDEPVQEFITAYSMVKNELQNQQNP